jgi:hypothetical protein
MRTFLLVFVVAVLVFIGVNLLWAHGQSDCGLPSLFGSGGCSDDIRRAGFPVQFWEEGGLAYRRIFSLPALVGDIAVGLLVSLAAGGLAQRFWGRPARRQGGG